MKRGRPQDKVSGLEDHLGYWMRMVSNTVSHSFAQKLESHEITVAEWVVLRIMFGQRDKISPSTVAEMMGFTRGAISKLVERLLKRDLLTRTEALGDRRFQEIELTRKGRLLVPKLAQLADENDAEFFSMLSKAEKKSLMAILRKIASHNGVISPPTN